MLNCTACTAYSCRARQRTPTRASYAQDSAFSRTKQSNTAYGFWQYNGCVSKARQTMRNRQRSCGMGVMDSSPGWHLPVTRPARRRLPHLQCQPFGTNWASPAMANACKATSAIRSVTIPV